MEYYVYIFYADQIPIYVGYGKGVRWKDHFSMSTNVRLNRYLAKHRENMPTIFAENLSVEDAKAVEIELIAKFGRQDLKTGTLYNLTNGGDGTSGLKMTPEQKARVKSGVNKRWENPEQRKQHSIAMTKATNSTEFREKVLARRPPDWIEYSKRKSLKRKAAKNSKIEAVRNALVRNDEAEMLLVSGIQTVNGLKRFLKRHGLIEK